jgi:hypothetical protein
MQWYKGNVKIKEGAKFSVTYEEISVEEYEIRLVINVSSSILLTVILLLPRSTLKYKFVL